ncbi:MAG TPA: hypothetical protein VFR23_13070 [Jiangellaceae bacterium]|nr:hypothetical protein [Jiangellaceae bacterium]
MPQFKIRHLGGAEEIVTAGRVAVDGPITLFESPSGGSWKVLYQVPSDEVDLVQRRVIEGAGMARWVTEQPRRIAASRIWS